MSKIENIYFEWLTSQIHTPNNNKTYNDLFSRMHNVEFIWLVPNDDNRIEDAMELRSEFTNQVGRKVPFKVVSVLEVLVALSRRVAFTAGGDAESWAWRLIKNLRLNKCHDPLTDRQITRIDEALYSLIWRTYEPNGRGGFFPLRYPHDDQTKLEIWFQMNAYIIEMDQRDHLDQPTFS